MKLDNCMIDIETLATDQDAAILSIGAVMFHPDGGVDKAGSFYVVVDLSSQFGREINPDTLYWWMDQRDAARKAVFNTLPDKRKSLPVALAELAAWYTAKGGKYVWSHGSTFDIPILAHAYKHDSLCDTPWHWRGVRDTRTLFGLAMSMGIEKPEPVKNKHHALGDAIRQAEDVITATTFIKKGGESDDQKTRWGSIPGKERLENEDQ
jgi:exodeoxyribonuclease VIII